MSYSSFSREEIAIMKKLNTPSKIQDFLNAIPINLEEHGDTCYSPRLVLKNRKAQCMEGAMFAAAVLRFHGHKPLLVDLETTKDDFDHVLAVFKVNNHWGAIAKTNHAVLRYREPIYKSIRELVMSYFHEYFLDTGKKTLRAYTDPINLEQFDHLAWETSNEEVWFIPDFLARAQHIKLIDKKQIQSLRKADPIEVKAGKITEY